MSKPGSSGRSTRVSNGLVALSSAAMLAVYSAGYLRTRPAAAKFAVAAERRPADLVVSPVAAPGATVAAPPATEPAPHVTPPVTTGSASTRAADQLTPVRRRLSLRRLVTASPAPAAESATALTVTTEPPAAPVTAPDPVPVPATVPTPPGAAKSPYRDGTYLGWGSSRHGDIQASVVIEGGRIASATIAQCLTRYSCSWIAALPGQVVSRQSPNVDFVSGATQSTDAFADAVADALSKAK
jgi:uncharacterized protein with FMN-binding domain